jgi:MFS superfamily sulfate permease-like transporter
MLPTNGPLSATLPRDLTSGLVVFLVALPLCLGVALASGAPLFSGVRAGIVGGILVGVLSGSHTSVSGPAAGLTAVVAAQILSLDHSRRSYWRWFLQGSSKSAWDSPGPDSSPPSSRPA